MVPVPVVINDLAVMVPSDAVMSPDEPANVIVFVEPFVTLMVPELPNILPALMAP